MIGLSACRYSTIGDRASQMFKGFDFLCQGTAGLLARALCLVALLWLAVVWAL